jgi:imidazolonepropionase
MESLLILNAAQVVTATGRPMRGPAMALLGVRKNCSIYVRDGLITAVGPIEEIERVIDGQASVIPGERCIVIPGLIDSHTHLVFAGTREGEFYMRIAGADYQEIAEKGGGIRSTVNATRQTGRAELTEIGLRYLAAALAHGTTTLEVKTGYGLDEEQEIKLLDVIADLQVAQPIELIPTFLGAHAIPDGKNVQQYTSEVIALLPRIAHRVRFCDVFCEKGYFGLEETRAIFTAAKQCGLGLRLHADQLTANDGVRLAIEMGAASVDHLEKITDAEIELLGSSDTCATLLPGVSLFLNYGYPPGRRLIDRNAVVAVASNFNPGSCMCLNMQLIMALACTQMALSAEEALNAATVNAACSLGLDHVGQILPGQQADLLLLDLGNYRQLPYYFGTNHVKTVIKRGRVVWRAE